MLTEPSNHAMERTADRRAFQFGNGFHTFTPSDARPRPPSLILFSLDVMTLSRGNIALIRLSGGLGIFLAVRIAAEAFEADYEHRLTVIPQYHLSLTPGQTLLGAGICLVIAMTCVIFGSLMDDNPDG